MESLSHFNQNLKDLDALLYQISIQTDPILLSQASIPDDITALLNDPSLSEALDLTSKSVTSLLNLLKPIATKLTQSTFKPKDKMTPYASFIIDEKPVVKTNHYQQLSFDDIIKSNPSVKPIKRRVPLSFTDPCVKCGAPNDYIYAHTKSQFKCKACTHTFTMRPTYHDEITHHCPYCENKLEVHHERKHYDVLLCPNTKCAFYLENKKDFDSGNHVHLKTISNTYKLRYHFRLFDFTLASLSDYNTFIFSKINLSKIYHNSYTVGLILTYYINYGLSSRKTAQILKEVHNIKISHQTIVNYAEACASILEYLNVNHGYKLSNTLTFDETYIKVSGKTHYVFFGSDTNKKIIASYRIFDTRSTKEAVLTLNESFMKYPCLPNDLTVIVDGNPIYNAAQVFFKMNDKPFDLFQVIGIKNNDDISLKYRSFKQAEERLNRTYKQNYYGTNGYGSLRNANVYMSLYVSFFNFLRKHSSLDYKPPIFLEAVSNQQLMPNQWLALIDYTLNTHVNKDMESGSFH